MNDPLKKYRRRIRAWKNRIRLKREWARYHSLFQSRQLIVPNEQTIQEIIKSKFPGLRRQKKGHLNILAIYHNYNWENESLAPSMSKFGSVRHYDWLERFNHQRRDWHGHLMEEMNNNLIHQVRAWIKKDSTDVIFTYLSGEIVTPDTMKAMASMDVPLVNMSLNDKESFVGRVRNGHASGVRDICRYFDICWTSTRDALEKYCVEGALPIYLPEGANPEVHKPYDDQKTIDVSFVGQCYGNRPETVRKLEARGVYVEAYGYGWPAGPLSSKEKVRMYSKSKINLGFGGVAGHKDTYCLKGRDFEIPMSGGFYLTEYHPELSGCYELGEEIVTYVNFEDLVKKIKYFLSNPEKAEVIRKKGFKRARRDHTWEMRFEKIFSLMGLI